MTNFKFANDPLVSTETLMAKVATQSIEFAEPIPAVTPLRLAAARPGLQGMESLVSTEFWAVPPGASQRPAAGAKRPVNAAGGNVVDLREAATRVKAKNKKKVKKGKGKSKDKGGSATVEVGTSRGIDSMLRNSYRTQLAMIALAARKANIMISVNGFLLSLLTVSSSYIMTTEPLLLIPSGLFLTTCVIAIVFAVLAARPQSVSKAHSSTNDFRSDRADLLVFEQYAHLSKEDHMSVMFEMMHDKRRVYQSMVSHLYFLGKSADKRFNLLKVSYNTFILGLISSFVSLIVVGLTFYL